MIRRFLDALRDDSDPVIPVEFWIVWGLIVMALAIIGGLLVLGGAML